MDSSICILSICVNSVQCVVFPCSYDSKAYTVCFYHYFFYVFYLTAKNVQEYVVIIQTFRHLKYLRIFSLPNNTQ